MGRSQSTPGLVESRGRIPLEEMWVSPLAPPPYSQHSLFSPAESPNRVLRAAGDHSPISIASSASVQQRLRTATTHRCNSVTGLSEGATPLLGSHEALQAEIKRLQEKLQIVETENAAMSLKLHNQQWDLESRIADIEMQICGSGSTSSLDEERNKESVI